MFTKCLLLALPLLLLPPQDDAARQARGLIEELRSDSIDKRTGATQKLISMGEGALPVLKDIRKSAGLDFRFRVDEIIRAIERQERLRLVFHPASQITIEAKEHSLKEVIGDLRKQGTTLITDDAIPESERVTVSLRNVPFWKALDEICKANGRVMWNVDSKKVTVLPGKYVARPSVFSGPFAIFVRGVDPAKPGGGGIRKLNVPRIKLVTCCEAGLKPERIVSVIHEPRDNDALPLPDDRRGFRGISMGFRDDDISWCDTFGISEKFAPRVNGKLRLSVVFHFRFVMRYASVAFPNPERSGNVTKTSNGLRFKLVRCTRQGITVAADIIVTGTDVDLDALAKEKYEVFGLEVIDWRESHGIVDSVSRDNAGLSFKVHFLVPQSRKLGELRVKMPIETHSESVRCEFGRPTFK